jgi:protein-disulfide isomerase
MSRRAKRQETVQRKKQKQRQLVIVIGSIIGVLILAGVLIYFLQPDDAPMPDGVMEKYADITQSVDANGVGHLGDPNATTVIREYSSFTCPHCHDLHDEVISEIIEFVRAGNVRIEFVPIHATGAAGGEEAAKAAICAGEQGKFWEMHDVLFHWEGLVNVSKARLDTAADELGLDTGEFDDCYDKSETGRLARQGYTEMQQYASGTPVVLVNGQVEQNPYNLLTRLNTQFGTGQ